MADVETEAAGPVSTAQLYRTMLLIRRFEETVIELVNTNEIPGTTHEYIGEEAVAAGVCAALTEEDVITSTHRGHGHCIAKGADVSRMMAELMAKSTGLNHGRGGSMHVADFSVGMLGANGIVGAGVPFALGAAWAKREAGNRSIAVPFFGDGTMAQGILSECLNIASLWSLPVVFVCENNRYAVSLRLEDSLAGNIADHARAYGIRADVADGMDASDVYHRMTELASYVRAGNGPGFLQCDTYRYGGHHTAESSLKLTYRTPDEVAEWRDRDPIEALGKLLDNDTAQRTAGEVDDVMSDAVAFARQSPEPASESALDFAYADDRVHARGEEC